MISSILHFVLGVAVFAIGIYGYMHSRKKQKLDKAQKGLSNLIQELQLTPNADGNIDPNMHLPNGNPLIIEVLTRQNLNYLDELIALHADVNAMDSQGKTVIFYCQSKESIAKLIQAGADVNARDMEGKTAIFYRQEITIVNALLDAGLDPCIKDNIGNTVLHYLSTEEDELSDSKYIAQLLLQRAPKLKFITGKDGQNAKIIAFIEKDEFSDSQSPNDLLAKAIHDGNLELAQIALDQGAAPSSIHQALMSNNMITSAVLNNNPELIQLLAKHGANVDESSNGCRLLSYAIINYYPECVKVLLDYGAKVTSDIINEAENYYHPEIYSMICKKDKVIKKEIPSDEILKECPKDYINKLLIGAVQSRDAESVERLLKLGADPNVPNGMYGLLAEAIKMDAQEVIQLLISGGAKLSSDRLTPIRMACFANQPGILQKLLDMGEKVDDKDNESITQCACIRIRKVWNEYNL